MNEQQITAMMESIFALLEKRLRDQIEAEIGWRVIWEKTNDHSQLILCQLGMNEDYFRLTHWVDNPEVPSFAWMLDKFNTMHYCELFIASTSGEASDRAQAYWVEHCERVKNA